MAVTMKTPSWTSPQKCKQKKKNATMIKKEVLVTKARRQKEKEKVAKKEKIPKKEKKKMS